MYIVCAALHPHSCRTHTSAPCALFPPPIPPACGTHAKSVSSMSALSACPIAIILYVTLTRVAPTHSSMSLNRWLSTPPAWVSVPYVLRYVFLIALIGIGKVEEYEQESTTPSIRRFFSFSPLFFPLTPGPQREYGDSYCTLLLQQLSKSTVKDLVTSPHPNTQYVRQYFVSIVHTVCVCVCVCIS
jgi:hypothetical protein